jgi:Arc/MetJ-type ribon-helix-helix transcriptional regulator
LQLQYNSNMKTATIPPIRVAPQFRLEVEDVLEQGESLSEFVENAVRQTVLRRKNQAEFLRRGIAAVEETRRADSGTPAHVVVARLEAKLAAAKRTQAQRKG